MITAPVTGAEVRLDSPPGSQAAGPGRCSKGSDSESAGESPTHCRTASGTRRR